MTDSDPKGPAAVELGPLTRDLHFMVRTLQSLLRPEGRALREAVEVEPGVIGVLLIVWLNPGISQSDLAASVVLKKSSVTALVKTLEAAGLLERNRVTADRRTNALTLTGEGHALIARIRTLSEAAQDRLFEGVPAADRDAFFRVARHLMDRLQAAGADNPAG